MPACNQTHYQIICTGKSSLIGAIFRMACVEGDIKIDGVDTSAISLEKLRSSIAIIPQDPVLFSGTLRRYCIDNLHTYTPQRCKISRPSSNHSEFITIHWLQKPWPVRGVRRCRHLERFGEGGVERCRIWSGGIRFARSGARQQFQRWPTPADLPGAGHSTEKSHPCAGWGNCERRPQVQIFTATSTSLFLRIFRISNRFVVCVPGPIYWSKKPFAKSSLNAQFWPSLIVCTQSSTQIEFSWWTLARLSSLMRHISCYSVIRAFSAAWWKLSDHRNIDDWL